MLLLAACAKKSDPDPEFVQGMHWTENGATVTADTTTVNLYPTGHRMYVVGSVTAGADINRMQLNVPRRIGTHVLGPSLGESAETYSVRGNSVSNYFSTSALAWDTVRGSGRIVVSRYDSSATVGASRIAGTFSFRAVGSRGTKTVRDGWFDVNY